MPRQVAVPRMSWQRSSRSKKWMMPAAIQSCSYCTLCLFALLCMSMWFNVHIICVSMCVQSGLQNYIVSGPQRHWLVVVSDGRLSFTTWASWKLKFLASDKWQAVEALQNASLWKLQKEIAVSGLYDPHPMSYQSIIFVVEVILGAGCHLKSITFPKSVRLVVPEAKSLYRCQHVVRYIAGAVVVEALRNGLNNFLSASEEKKQNSGLERDIV